MAGFITMAHTKRIQGLTLLLAVLANPIAQVCAECSYTSVPGTIIWGAPDLLGSWQDPDCESCDPLPLLLVGADGYGNWDIYIEPGDPADCVIDAQEVVIDNKADALNPGGSIDDCPTPEPYHYWTVFHIDASAANAELPIGAHEAWDSRDGIVDAGLAVGRKDLVTTEQYSFLPLFPVTGTYEIRRYSKDCGEGSSYAALALRVEVTQPLRATSIHFDGSLSTATAVQTLVEYAASPEVTGCVDRIVPDDTLRVLCSNGVGAPGLEAYDFFTMEGCGVESVEWESFEEGTGVWSPMSVSNPVEDLSSEDVAANLPSRGYVRFRRVDTSSGDTTTTNALTVAIIGDINVRVTPARQDVCQSGVREDLVAELRQTPTGRVQYLWQSRLLEPGAEWQMIPDAFGAAITPTADSRDYQALVWAIQDTAVNLAPGGIATQSSTFPGGDAANAIDGNPQGNWGDDLLSRTALADSSPWWSVAFDQNHELTRVKLWNREDCCRFRLTNFRIRVISESGSDSYSEDFYTGGGGVLGDESFTLPEGTIGNEVRIEILGPNSFGETNLTLAEVEVFGFPRCGPYLSNMVRVIVGDDDANPAAYFPDTDGDGYPNKSGASQVFCADPGDGWALGALEEDCNDGNPILRPGQLWYFDGDEDNLIAFDAEPVESCQRPMPFSQWKRRNPEDPWDCDDTDPNVNTAESWLKDEDGDGFSVGEVVISCAPPLGYRSVDEIVGGDDCNDLDPNENPGQSWYPDADSDGQGGGPAVESCTRPEGYFTAEELTGTTDCDDTDPLYFEDESWYRDADGDGFPAAAPGSEDADVASSCGPQDDFTKRAHELVSLDVDCDDEDPERFPGQAWYPDGDADGLGDAFASPTFDCNPPSPTMAANHRDCDDGNSDPARCLPDADAGATLELSLGDALAADSWNGTGETPLGSFGDSDFLVEAWIRTSAARAQVIISKGSSCAESNAWGMRLRADGVAEAFVTSGIGAKLELSGQTSLNDDEWHHVALRRIDDELSIWVDSLPEARDSIGTELRIRGRRDVVVGNDLPLGGDGCEPGFEGKIDNVRIWAASRSLAESGPDLHRVVDAESLGLVVYWSFDKTVPHDGEIYAADSAVGFPLLVERGNRVGSTAPVGVGTAQISVFLPAEGGPGDFIHDGAGLRVNGAVLDAVAATATTTRLAVPPAGELPPKRAPLTDSYWILDLLGPASSIQGDLTLQFETDVISAGTAGRLEEISLYSRPANSDGEWTFVATAAAANEASEQVRFNGVTLTRSQLVVMDSGEPDETPLYRGDCNQDLSVDLSDGIFDLNFLFVSGEPPTCVEACEVNGDGQNDLSDPVYLLNYLFISGPAPEVPFLGCGLDPDPAGSLGCEVTACP